MLYTKKMIYFRYALLDLLLGTIRRRHIGESDGGKYIVLEGSIKRDIKVNGQWCDRKGQERKGLGCGMEEEIEGWGRFGG